VLSTDTLKFGFKDNSSCADAICTLLSQHLITLLSALVLFCVQYTASLDITYNAFNRVNHYKMYNSLLCADVPVVIVDVLAIGTVIWLSQ